MRGALREQVGSMMEATLPALRSAVALVDAVLSAEPATSPSLEALQPLALACADSLRPALEATRDLALALDVDPQALRELPEVLHPTGPA